MPQNLKVIYTAGVPVVADFNATDGPPLCVDSSTGILYGLARGGGGVDVVAVLTPCQQANAAVFATGSTQATATELDVGLNYVSSVPPGTGVSLLSYTAGTAQTVYNGGLNPLKVYPWVGGQINQLATNAAMTLAVNTTCRFDLVSATQIIALLSA